MHGETSRSHQVLKDGTERVYQRHLLRRSYRDGGKVRKETLANLSHLPEDAIEAVRLVLAGKSVVDADGGVEVTRSLGHGHVAAVHAQARALGFPGLLGPPCRERDLAYALIVSRVAGPPPSCPRSAGGMTPPWVVICGWPGPAPMRSMRRWTGWWPGRTRSRLRWRAGTCGRAGWPCSTYRRRGWKGRIASWPRSGIPATASAASPRSGTGCSPTGKAARDLRVLHPARGPGVLALHPGGRRAL
jgi:hypothetical protein